MIAVFFLGVVLGAVTTTHMGGRAAFVPAGVILLDYVFIRVRRRIRGYSELGPEAGPPAATTPPPP